jgi:hypothetical protein
LKADAGRSASLYMLTLEHFQKKSGPRTGAALFSSGSG